MKKILFVALFLLATLTASSQIRIEAGTSIGGFSVATTNYSAKAGFTAGAFYDFGLLSNEAIAVGLQYTENAYSASGIDGKVSWLQLPIESHWKFLTNDKFHMFFDAGFFLGFALRRSANVYWKYDTAPVVTDISDSVRRFNFGTTVGIGLGFGRISLRINWQRGFLNLMGPTPDNIYTTNAYNTRSWRITAGFSF